MMPHHLTGEKARLEPQNAEEGDFTDLEGLDLTSKLDLLRKNEQWKCQVKKEALEVRCRGRGAEKNHLRLSTWCRLFRALSVPR